MSNGCVSGLMIFILVRQWHPQSFKPRFLLSTLDDLLVAVPMNENLSELEKKEEQINRLNFLDFLKVNCLDG